MRLKRGRSKQSYLLVAFDNAHLFLWHPWSSERANSFGATFRYRRGSVWTHWRLTLLARNVLGRRWHWNSQRKGRFAFRPTLTIFSVERWRTAPGTKDERIDVKAHLRLKLSAGGRRISGPGASVPPRGRRTSGTVPAPRA